VPKQRAKSAGLMRPRVAGDADGAAAAAAGGAGWSGMTRCDSGVDLCLSSPDETR
jgi:hypothetical protein